MAVSQFQDQGMLVSLLFSMLAAVVEAGQGQGSGFDPLAGLHPVNLAAVGLHETYQGLIGRVLSAQPG